MKGLNGLSGLDVSKMPSLKDINIQLARTKFLEFIKYTWPKYQVHWHHAAIAEKLDQFARGKIKRLMLFVPPQHGKLIKNHQIILTPDGARLHGDLRVGDYVFGRDGKPVRVLWVSEEDYADYEVEFTDGQVIQCHGAHEWVVFDRRKHGSPERRMETRQMLEEGVWIGNHGRGGRARFQVDANVALEYPEMELPVHPYVLGAWLGDGRSTQGSVCHHKDDAQTVKKITSCGYELKAQRIHNGTGVVYSSFKGLMQPLRKMGLYNNKHIPAIYLNASREQRLELLAGLIDTDGYVYHKNGRVTFSNCNKFLIENVRELVVGLGWRATVTAFEPKMSTSGIQGKQTVYQLCFNPDCDIPVAIPRKKLQKTSPIVRRRAIREIRKAAVPQKGRCIEVEGGVYLVGENNVPTHNSQQSSRHLPAYLMGLHPTKKISVISYSDTLAGKFGKAAQRIVESQEFQDVFPNVRIPKKGNMLGLERNADTCETLDAQGKPWGGELRTIGTGNSITGNSVDIAIIDDPVKGRLEAESSTTRERTWDWYVDELMTRLDNDGQILILCTRWHEDDLPGRLLKQDKENQLKGKPKEWEVIVYPAIFDGIDAADNDPREMGEALWPKKHSAEKILQQKEKSLRTFNSLYQQRPSTPEGNIFKMDSIGVLSWPEFSERLRGRRTHWDFYVDGAYTEKTKNDPSAIYASTIYNNDVYIRKVSEVRLEFPDLCEYLGQFVRQNGYSTHSTIYVEPKANGLSIIQAMKRATRLNITKYKWPLCEGERLDDKDKVTRANAVAPTVNSGRVFLIEDGSGWTQNFMEQLAAFPNMAHDDMVDCFVMDISRRFFNRTGARGITKD